MMKIQALYCIMLCSIIGLYCSPKAHAQNLTTISGYVVDNRSSEPLISATLCDQTTHIGTNTNEYGFFSLSLPKGEKQIAVSFIGYQTKLISIPFQNDTLITIRLSQQTTEVEEVIVSARQSKVDDTQMSSVQLSSKILNRVPVILGEPDVLKVIQLLPGVQSGTEGTSGIHVRGGSADQNLFLLDGVPVYNASHLFGFFSVFNPSAVKTVKLYKGGFPARFGGRLSSVLDIRMKEGNMEHFEGDFSIGLISSRFNLEGPIVKGKTSFLISARRTYVDALTMPLQKYFNKEDKNYKELLGYYFYDMNAKINHKFSDRSKLYLSTYLGQDKFYTESESFQYNDWDEYGEPTGDLVNRDSEDSNINWGNKIAALRWNYLLNTKLFLNTTLTYSKYGFNTNFYSKYENDLNTSTPKSTYEEYDYFSSIEDIAAKFDFEYIPSYKHTIRFGLGATKHQFRPGVETERYDYDEEDNGELTTTQTPENTVDAMEYFTFVEDNIKFNNWLQGNIGLHFSAFDVQGKLNNNIQPRASLLAKVHPRWSIKTSYAKMVQYVHLLTTSDISLPTDLWVPVTAKLTPPVSNQYALGVAHKLGNGIDLTLEGYYKEMNNLIEYKPGAGFSGAVDSNWDQKIESGQGWSYGAEILLEKSIGKTTGWIGYTWSKTERQFKNTEINNGEKFPARYDRRHDVSIALTHKFSDRFDIGMAWVYNTGNAVTFDSYQYLPIHDIHLPSNDYEGYEGTTPSVKDYDGKNNYRMPAYHRMDVGLNWHKPKKHGVRTWSLSFYNAYCRMNPFYLEWKETLEMDPRKDRKYVSQVSIFPIIPSVSYSYKFGKPKAKPTNF